MWTSSGMKSAAKQKLQGRYGKYLLVAFLYEGIMLALDTVVNLLTPQHVSVLDWLMTNYFVQTYRQIGVDVYQYFPDLFPTDIVLTYGDVFIDVVATLVGLLLTWMIYNILEVGMDRYIMEARGNGESTGTLFSCFGHGQWSNIVVVRFVVWLRTLLWGLLLWVPGIIYSYKTIMVPFLLAENPYMKKKRAIELSTAMTNGEKMKIFCLQLSFFGWFLLIGIVSGILGTITTGGTYAYVVGMILLLPYIQATMAELYAYFRQKAFQMGVTDATELAGFATGTPQA